MSNTKPKEPQITSKGLFSVSIVAIIFFSIVGFIAYAVISAGNSNQTSNTTPPAPQTPAYKLATYDLNQAPDTSTVATYQSALDSLKHFAPKTEDESRLAALIWATWSDLKKNGVQDETNLTLIGHIKDSIPANSQPVNCQGVMASYAVLREPHN